MTETPGVASLGPTAAARLSASAELTVTPDVPYATLGSLSDDPWLAPVLDVYAPAGARDLPLVVMFHASPDHHDKNGYSAVAEAMARSGAVVVAPNWGIRLSNGDMLAAGAEPRQVVDAWQLQLDESACAIDFSVDHAESWGADPSRLALVGDSVGANVASVLGLKGADPFPGCASPRRDWVARGLMLLEGDWILEDPSWDVLRENGAALMPVFTPWTMLDNHAGLPVKFGITESSRQSMRRCDPSRTPQWLEWHDPEGVLAGRLQALGAYADDCIDIREESELLAGAMKERGISASIVDFTDPASSSVALAGPELLRLADHVRSLAHGRVG